MDHTLTMYEDIPRVGRSYMYDDILSAEEFLRKGIRHKQLAAGQLCRSL